MLLPERSVIVLLVELMEDAFELVVLSVVLDSSVDGRLVLADLSYDEIELESATLSIGPSKDDLFKLSGLDETSWKDSSSSLWEGVLDECGEPSLTVASSCSSAMAERSGDGGSGFNLWNMRGSIEKGSWTVSLVGGS